MAEGDPVRLLHARSELGYTSSAMKAMVGEPEAADQGTQERITANAHRGDREERIREWRAAHTAITEAVTAFKASCRVDRGLANGLRVIERQCARLDQHVAR
jgi:hypothetical protein